MLLFTLLDQMFPPKAKWTPTDIPDLDGKTFLVTGGNTGLGKETCKHLLLKGGDVWFTARSASKAEQAIAELEKETGRQARFLQLDLSDLSSVKRSAEEFKTKQQRLDALILNAGVMHPPIEQLTTQGYDMQFGTNVLGHFLLIKLLLPLLRSTATGPLAKGEPSRIVWVSSSTNYYFNPPVKYDTLKDSPQRTALGNFQLYAQSKFATVMLVFKLAKLLEGDYGANGKVVANVVDPGNIRTELQRYATFGERILVRCARPHACAVALTSPTVQHWILLHPTPLGAYTQLYAATSPEAARQNGKYFYPWARTTDPAQGTFDEREQDKIWDFCEEAVKPFA
ncbi:NAD(P)-binding protein [Punctularia strigosozonata HHB-11173 SS5]|uniref:NAD(P)-binding protein n=1 Tax=Punctularia strigosozonata (strain HHB-11173) TaxID=741275 RepID=UPI00044162F1|nr:NAD(P)-binding protein [Punctularia strigosozonata HHB-11173 SS5]EIN10118.1 NAD(P)-binding protein [Punctularia strigosozonata HHB-11173 SS5]